jgi:hypothetical protein
MQNGSETFCIELPLAYKRIETVIKSLFFCFRREMEFALGHRRLRVQRAPVTYSVQFQNGGFSLSDLIYISHSFVEFSKNCAGFLWILRCVALWPF